MTGQAAASAEVIESVGLKNALIIFGVIAIGILYRDMLKRIRELEAWRVEKLEKIIEQNNEAMKSCSAARRLDPRRLPIVLFVAALFIFAGCEFPAPSNKVDDTSVIEVVND